VGSSSVSRPLRTSAHRAERPAGAAPSAAEEAAAGSDSQSSANAARALAVAHPRGVAAAKPATCANAGWAAGSLPQGPANGVRAHANSSLTRKGSVSTTGAERPPEAHGLAAQGLTNSRWASGTPVQARAPPAGAVPSAPRHGAAGLTLQELALGSWPRGTPHHDGAASPGWAPSAAAPGPAETPDLDWDRPGRGRRGGAPRGAGEAVPPDMVHCIAEAFSSLGRLRPGLLAACSGALGRLAARMDAAHPERAAAAEPPVGSGGSRHDGPTMLLEQSNVCVLLKPPQWVVTVNNQYTGVGRRSEEEVEAEGGDLLLQTWVLRRLGPRFPVAADVAAQHGIVHRLDRGTSGPLLVARTYRGYFEARLQFAARRVGKEYVCLCHGLLRPGPQLLRAPLRVDARQARRRAKVAPGVRPARTQVCRVAHLVGPGGLSAGDVYSLAEVRLHTGRRHQIRAHLSYEGHSLVGDEVYGCGAEGWCPGLFLHSCLLAFGMGDGPTTVVAPLPAGLYRALAALPAMDRASVARALNWLRMPARGALGE